MVLTRWLAFLSLLALSVFDVRGQEKKPSVVRPYVTYYGSTCKIKTATCRLVMADEFFDKLLEDSGVKFSPSAQVDLDTCMVIAFFAGKSEWVQGVDVFAIEEGPSELVFKISRSLRPKSEGPKAATAWKFLLLPRSSKKIVIHELKPSEPEQWLDTWTKVAELPPRSCADMLRQP